MKKKKFKYLLLLPILFFAACEPEGLDEQRPFDPEKGAITSDTSLKARTVQEYPLDGTRYSRERLGHINDPIFGATTAKLAFQLSLPAAEEDDDPWSGFESDVEITSVFMDIAFTGDPAYYGSERSHMTIGAYLLDKVLLDSNYLTNTEFPVSSENYSTFSEEVVDPEDGVLRINLTEAFANHFTSLPESTFETNNTLRNAFPGLYLEPEALTGQRTGGIYYFNLRSSLSTLTFITSDDDTVRFPVGSNATLVNLFKHDHKRSVFHEQLGTENETFETVYVQPMSGVKTHIQLPSIKAILGEEKRAIHQAELIIPYEASATFPPPSRLILAKAGENLENLSIPDMDLQHYGGSINREKQYYRFIITRHIQELAKNYYDDPGFANTGLNLIIPGDAPVANRLVIPVTQNDQPLQLNIRTSKIREE